MSNHEPHPGAICDRLIAGLLAPTLFVGTWVLAGMTFPEDRPYIGMFRGIEFKYDFPIHWLGLRNWGLVIAAVGAFVALVLATHAAMGVLRRRPQLV